MPVEAPPRAPEEKELEALIEEARRRAWRRRFGYLVVIAAAIVAASIYLLIGGGGNGPSSRSSSEGPTPGAGTSSGPSAAAQTYRCPTKLAALKRSPRGGVPGCSIRFWADLPSGWHERPSTDVVFPPAFLNRLPGPPDLSDVRFANFPLPRVGIWPVRTPPDGIAIALFSKAPALRPKSLPNPAVHLTPEDFQRADAQHHQWIATARLYTGGWRFQVEARVDASGPELKPVHEANLLLNSIETTQHLCPCPARPVVTPAP